MIVGVVVVNTGRNSIVGMAATYTKALMQHYSGIVEHDQFKEMLKKGATKHEQEQKLCESRAQILCKFLQGAF